MDLRYFEWFVWVVLIERLMLAEADYFVNVVMHISRIGHKCLKLQIMEGDVGFEQKEWAQNVGFCCLGFLTSCAWMRRSGKD